MPSVGRLFFEIGGDKSKLDQTLREAVEAARSAGVEVTRSGQSIISAFNQGLNPTKRLGEEIRLLESTGKSSSEIWAVYGRRMTDAAEAAKRNGQAIDPLVSRHLELNKSVEESRFSLENLGKTIQDFARDPVGSAKAGVSSLLESLGPTATTIGAIGTVAAVAAKALFDMGAEAAAQAERFQNLSISTGLSVQQLQALEQIGKEAGIEGLNLSKTLGMLNQQLGSNQGGDFVNAMVKADIALQRTDGSAKDVVELLDELRSNLIKIEDPAKRAQEAQAALGGRLRELIPLLLSSNQSLSDQIQVMKQTGPVWDEITQEKLLKFDAALDRIGRTWSSIVTDIKAGVGSILGSLFDLGKAGEIDLRKLSPEQRIRMDLEMNKSLQGFALPTLPFNPDVEALREAPKMARELFNEQQKLVAQNEQDVALKLRKIEAQREFDRVIERGTREEVEAQAKVLSGINAEIENRRREQEGLKLYYQLISERNKAAVSSVRDLGKEYRDVTEEVIRGMREHARSLQDDGPELKVIYDEREIREAADAVHRELEKVREQERKLWQDADHEIRKQAGGVFDALLSRGKGAFSQLGDWIEAFFMTRLKRLFENVVSGAMNGFQGGLKGIIEGVVPGLGGKAGTAGAVQSRGVFGLGSATIPVLSAAVSGLAYAIPKLISAISGKSSEEAGAAEVKRDLKIDYGKDQFRSFYESLGLSESSSYGIRKDLIVSPKFLVEQAYPIAQATGKLNEFYKALEKIGTAWGTFDFRAAFRVGELTGDWEALNQAFQKAWGSGGQLAQKIPDWKTALAAGAESAKSEVDKLSESLAKLRKELDSSITPAQTMYDKFLATTEITEEFARQIERVGGSVARFKELASLNLRMTGLQESLGFIQSLSSSLKSLAPELDPIQQILKGAMGPEAIAALTKAGVDPARFTGLSSLIGTKQSFEGFQPYQTLTPELRQALLSYGGSAGKTAVERYGQGINTISADLLSSTKATMDQAYQTAIKDALAYLGEAEEKTADQMESLVSAIDAVKIDIVGVLDKILLALQGGAITPGSTSISSPEQNQFAIDYAEWRRKMTELQNRQTSGVIDDLNKKIAISILEKLQPRPEDYMSAQPIQIQIQNSYGFDDFASKVRQAGFDIIGRGGSFAY